MEQRPSSAAHMQSMPIMFLFLNRKSPEKRTHAKLTSKTVIPPANQALAHAPSLKQWLPRPACFLFDLGVVSRFHDRHCQPLELKKIIRSEATS